MSNLTLTITTAPFVTELHAETMQAMDHFVIKGLKRHEAAALAAGIEQQLRAGKTLAEVILQPASSPEAQTLAEEIHRRFDDTFFARIQALCS